LLIQLIIDNFAIIKKVDIDFKNGMNSITGETGAGKSIILSALKLIMGEKAISKLVRDGEDKAEVHAVFDIEFVPKVKEILENKGLDSDNECILKRVLFKDGKSVAYINNSRATIKDLKEISDELISLNGQHTNQDLLNPIKQLSLVDNFSKNQDLLILIESKYFEINKKIKYKNDYEKNYNELKDKYDLLNFQLKELSDLNLLENEYNLLESEFKSLSSSEDNIINLKTALFEMENDEYSSSSALKKAISNLNKVSIKSEKIDETINMLSEALINIEESVSNVDFLSESFEVDPEKLMEVENRISEINEMSLKYKKKPAELLKYLEYLEEETQKYDYSNINIEDLEKEIDLLKQEYYNIAQKITDSRKKSAINLSSLINKELESLNMSKNLLRINVETKIESFNRNGVDEISFYIKPNEGQSESLMKSIVSGGELSRISLATNVIESNFSKGKTLIFDEVDTGIGGQTANNIGVLLKRLGMSHQIICITHLAQVASFANYHYFIDKKTLENKTFSSITKLSYQERVEELARMISGNKTDSISIDQALKMIKQGELIDE
jgi:DNA repair protein RecN (Recombination protein N)